jgi:hypothetical protein
VVIQWVEETPLHLASMVALAHHQDAVPAPEERVARLARVIEVSVVEAEVDRPAGPHGVLDAGRVA